MNLAEWLQGDHEPSQRLKAVQSLCRAVTERAGGAGLSLDPSKIEVSASGECRPEAGKGAPPGRYRAPEIADGRPATPQSQVYTAGVLCYEILAGRAFEPRGAPLLRDIRPDLPRDLSDAVQACLEMDAEWRPKDLTYVLGLIDGMGPATAVPGSGGRSSRPSSGVSPAPASRSGRGGRGGPAPRPWPLLAFALVALAASVATAIYRLRQPPPAPALPPPGPAVTMAATTLPPSPESSAPAAKPASAAPSTDLTRPTTAPTPVASASPRAGRPSPSPSPSAAIALATPVAAPTAAAAPSAPPVVAATAPPVAAEPAAPAAVTSVAPPLLRRGATVLVDVHGVGLRSEHQVRIGRAREAAKGIEVMRQRYVSPVLLQVLLKVDAAAAPGAYVLSLVDGAGNATNTRPFEIAR